MTKLQQQKQVTMVERTMTAFKIPKEQWAYKLAPQLTGKAFGAGMYTDVKAAILQRYNINKPIQPKEDKTHQELAVRVQDLTGKFAKDCKKVEDVLELIATEQLLPTNGG